MTDASKALPRADASTEGSRGSRPDIIDGPIVPTLLRLALPTVIVLLVQTAVGVAEIIFVSRLGTDALAGVTLVFPVLMLMIATANAGFGGGVASAVARATGRRDVNALSALGWHALVIGVSIGAVLAAIVIVAGPWLYAALGGKGRVLEIALSYSAIVFAGSPALWVTALLAAGLRGAGDVRTPAIVSLAGAAFTLAASPLLIFGAGPLPGYGAIGAAMALVAFNVLGAVILMLRMRARTSPLRLTVGPLVPGLLRDILTVGGLAAVGTSLSNITLALVTGAAGVFGAAAIAGYGIATRLDAVLIPILFGIGTGVVTMVGAALGAGNVTRAREVAMTGVTIGAALSGTAGIVLALAPGLWTGLFTSDPAVHDAAASYLRIAGPFYGFLGAGLMMFFAAQGARRIGWPVAFGIVRLTLAGLIGWWLVAAIGLPLWALSATIAASLFIFGTGTVVAVLSVPWSDKRSE